MNKKTDNKTIRASSSYIEVKSPNLRISTTIPFFNKLCEKLREYSDWAAELITPIVTQMLQTVGMHSEEFREAIKYLLGLFIKKLGVKMHGKKFRGRTIRYLKKLGLYPN